MRRSLFARGIVFAAVLAAGTVSAEPYEGIEDLQRLFTQDTVGLITVEPEIADRVRALMDEANRHRSEGRNGAMRAKLAEARALLKGVEWNEDVRFVASLAPVPDARVIDPSRPLRLRVGQHFASAAPPGLAVSVELRAADGTAAKIEPLTDLGVPRDWADRPAVASYSLTGAADGSYDLVVMARRQDEVVGSVAVRVYVVSGLDRDRAAIAAAPVAPDPRLDALIRYPVDLADGLDAGTRDIVRYDFRAGLDRSLALIRAAKDGRNPLADARGEQSRAYRSTLTNRIEPYRIYVPEDWDGKAPLPLVVMLHGSNGDENSSFADGTAAREAERRGWALLAPFGYSPNSGWGNHRPVVLANETMPEARPMKIDGVVWPGNGIDPEPAEQDVLATLSLVRSEYPIDPARIYLIGNSMGGEGAWHLGQAYPHLWAAIVPAAGAIDPDRFPYSRLARLPVLVVHGTEDTIISFAASKHMFEALRDIGAPVELLAVKGAGHRAFHEVLPRIFDFLARQRRSDGGTMTVTPAP